MERFISSIGKRSIFSSNTIRYLSTKTDGKALSFPMKHTSPLRPPPEYAQLRKEDSLKKGKNLGWKFSLDGITT